MPTLVPLSDDLFEHFSLELNPKRIYGAQEPVHASGTYEVTTGSVRLFPRASSVEKEPHRLSPFLESATVEGGPQDVDGALAEAKRLASISGSNYNALKGLLEGMTELSQSARRARSFDVIRFSPGTTLDRQFSAKRHIRETLFPFYRTSYPSLHWAYHNYNSLNFFTGSMSEDGLTGSVPEDTVLMYPNTNAGAGVSGNVYLPNGAFSFDFRINPRYTTPKTGSTWTNGTIFHMSGVYALSLLTGSKRDINGYPDHFRLAFQVLSGTYTLPSDISAAANSVFLSDDNVLKRGHWHRVVVRWGTEARNSGTGSFIVDGVDAGDFVIPSASLMDNLNASPDVLYIGNFYEGPHTGSNTQSRFFSNNAATREGVVELQSDPSSGDLDAPTGWRFAHPLNAEVHELRIWDEYLEGSDLMSGSDTSPVGTGSLLFYVPPFFTAESPRREAVSNVGGVLQTPFFAVDSRTDDPFNVAMSFGVAGHYINLENFTRDFVQDNYPRAFNLTASQLASTTAVKSADEFLYATGSVRKRNLTVMPCDDGSFLPDFSLLSTGTITFVPKTGTLNFKHANDLGVYDASLVRLTDLIPSNSYHSPLSADSGSLFNQVVGARPDNPGVDPGEVLTVFQRTRDNSSNQVTIFDVSDMFYGRRIVPGSVVLTDAALTGSGGVIPVTLRDNGHGSMYRADATTQHAKWASVGNVLYDEGIIVVKSPHLMFYGREAYRLEFRGSQHVHTMKVRVPAGAGMHTSSSNPSFEPISASFDANDYDPRFVYITGINFHDENLNVVMKSSLAQPVVKRTGERIVFKPGLDW